MTNPQSDAMEAAARAIWQRHMQIVWEGGEAPICEWGELPPSQRASQRDVISSAITAYLAALEASGWAVVPVEPCGQILQKGLSCIAEFVGGEPTVGDARVIYRAMIAARPRVEG